MIFACVISMYLKQCLNCKAVNESHLSILTGVHLALDNSIDAKEKSEKELFFFILATRTQVCVESILVLGLFH